MAANLPDLGAVSHLGSQFHHNVFAHAQKSLNTKSKQYADAHNTQVKQTAAAREKFAQSAAQGIKQGQAAYAKNVAGQQKQAAQAAKAHAAGVKSGKVAPAQGAAPRTFAMGTTPQQKAAQKAAAQQSAAGAKTMQQQRNFAHGQALNYQAAQFRVQQQQVNNAHGQAIQEANKRAKGGPPVNTSSAPKAPSLSPAFSNPTPSHTPVKAVAIPSTSFSSQLAPQKPVAKPQGTAAPTFSSGSSNGASAPAAAPRKPPVSTQFSSAPNSGGGNFPLHSHPAGSSTAPLPNLTAAQPRPNTFTVGSRNAQPNGIAARGSQLEAWAIGRQAEVRKQRGSNNTQMRLGD